MTANNTDALGIPAGSDFELSRLETEYAKAYAAWSAEAARLEQLQDSYTRAALALPSRRDVMKLERDVEMGLCSRPREFGLSADGVFTEGEVDDLRNVPRTRPVERAVLPSDGLPADAVTLVTSELWPEAQARADEIVAAYDRWVADLAKLDEGNGIEAQEQVTDAALKAERRLADALACLPAHSLDGICAKVRAMNVSDPIMDFRADTAEPELLASILVDLARLAGLRVPPMKPCPDGFVRYVDGDGELWFRAV